MKKTIRCYLLANFVLLLGLATPILAQSRDHLTPKEVELVQDAQVLDQRIEVFIKAIERRLMVMNGTESANAKQLKKESELWGELPKGTRAELLGDIGRILDEAITNIDDSSTRDEKNPLVASSRLGAEATQLRNQLLPLREQAKSEEELASLEHLLEDGQSIIDATTKLPPASAEQKGKKKTSQSGKTTERWSPVPQSFRGGRCPRLKLKQSRQVVPDVEPAATPAPAISSRLATARSNPRGFAIQCRCQSRFVTVLTAGFGTRQFCRGTTGSK
jgi:hypothetical protein